MALTRNFFRETVPLTMPSNGNTSEGAL